MVQLGGQSGPGRARPRKKNCKMYPKTPKFAANLQHTKCSFGPSDITPRVQGQGKAAPCDGLVGVAVGDSACETCGLGGDEDVCFLVGGRSERGQEGANDGERKGVWMRVVAVANDRGVGEGRSVGKGKGEGEGEGVGVGEGEGGGEAEVSAVAGLTMRVRVRPNTNAQDAAVASPARRLTVCTSPMAVTAQTSAAKAMISWSPVPSNPRKAHIRMLKQEHAMIASTNPATTAIRRLRRTGAHHWLCAPGSRSCQRSPASARAAVGTRNTVIQRAPQAKPRRPVMALRPQGLSISRGAHTIRPLRVASEASSAATPTL